MITTEFIAEVLRSATRGNMRMICSKRDKECISNIITDIGVNPSNSFILDTLMAIIAQVITRQSKPFAFY